MFDNQLKWVDESPLPQLIIGLVGLKVDSKVFLFSIPLISTYRVRTFIP